MTSSRARKLVVFNRFKPEMDKMDFHKIVRAANRRSDIAYEAADGSVVYDDIEDPLPFDIEAPVIEIADRTMRSGTATWPRSPKNTTARPSA